MRQEVPNSEDRVEWLIMLINEFELRTVEENVGEHIYPKVEKGVKDVDQSETE